MIGLIGQTREQSQADVTMGLLLVCAAAATLILAFVLVRMMRQGAQVRSLRDRVSALGRELILIRRSLAAARIADRLRRVDREPSIPIEFNAPIGEDLVLWDLFDEKLDGRFIEVGAGDGRSRSVTHALEAAGWSGVLTVADPRLFERCVKHRTASQVAHASLGPRGSKGQTTLSIPGEGKSAPSEVSVPLSTLDDVLAAADASPHPPQPARQPLSAGPIDVLVIEALGSEAKVLDGADLERWRVRAILVRDAEPRNLAGPSAFLSRRHYTLVGRLGERGLFIRTDDEHLIRRAASLGGLVRAV